MKQNAISKRCIFVTPGTHGSPPGDPKGYFLAPAAGMGVVTWLLVGAVVVLLWTFSRRCHSYWSSRGIVSPPAVTFLGHTHELFSSQRRFFVDKVSCGSEEWRRAK